MTNNILIIGAGGVGRVVAHKCAQMPDVFSNIMLASRTLQKCTQIAADVPADIQTAQVDADNTSELVALIRSFKPAMVINVALPYQDLSIMDACLETGIHYLDTANYESPDKAEFGYSRQWDYHDRFKERGIMALLGSGFDPGVTNVFTAYALKHHFDKIDGLDILDCNTGEHGQAFATNFNPEINIREITQNGKYWDNGTWQTIPPMSISKEYEFPEGIGSKKIYLLYHEELESLTVHIPSIKKARFWMTFSESYLTYLRVLESIGMTSIEPIVHKGTSIVPLQFLKTLLPDPGSLGSLTTGKTCIGCRIKGEKDGKPKQYFIYNISSHEGAYRDVGSQAISYTTGIPATVGAKLILEGTWHGTGVFNMEQFDPDPFLKNITAYGLPWNEIHL